MIGERIEEARKRKGVSIREAAEATKIRGDYLMMMEDNSFKIPLPQIYVRGFLKNYARYLKLDPNKILTDYDAHLLGRTPHSPDSIRGSRESFGQVEIPENAENDRRRPADDERIIVTEAPDEDEDGPEPEMRFSLDEDQRGAPPPPPNLEKQGMRRDQEAWNENKTLYMKIGLVFAGILVVSIILVVLIQLLGREPAPEINPEVATATRQTSAESTSQPPVETLDASTFTITASDNVTLIVEQTNDKKRLYSGSLNAGETIALEKEGPVSIRFTNGAAVLIERGGQQFRPGQSGVGRTVIE